MTCESLQRGSTAKFREVSNQASLFEDCIGGHLLSVDTHQRDLTH